MQPMLIVHSDVAGLLYVNGHLAGEVSDGHSACLPVSPGGALYLEHRPMAAGYLPLARRLALSGGCPVPASLDGQKGLEVIFWPCGAVEARLAPERIEGGCPRAQVYAREGMAFKYYASSPPRVEIIHEEATYAHALPDGALPPEIKRLGGCALLLGETEGGERYLVALTGDCSARLFALCAPQLDLTAEGAQAVVPLNDVAGHARLIRWAFEEGAVRTEQADAAWAEGAPHWPDTPEGTALAALQAANLGLNDEATAYCAPGFDAQGNEAFAAARAADACLPLSYPLPDGRSAVGLATELGADGNCAQVRAVVYHALPLGGPQGAWRLDRLELV